MNLIPHILSMENYTQVFPMTMKVTELKKLDSTRFFAEEIFDYPFPLNKRKADVYAQLFNTIQENGKFMVTVRSIKRASLKDKKFWLPSHIIEDGNEVLASKKKSQNNYVEMNIDTFALQYTLHDDSSFTVEGYSNWCPNASISIPTLFHGYFGKMFTLGTQDKMNHFFGSLN